MLLPALLRDLQPALQPALQLVLQPAPQPALQPAPQPTPQPTPQPAPQPALQPAPQPTPQPASQPALQPPVQHIQNQQCTHHTPPTQVPYASCRSTPDHQAPHYQPSLALYTQYEPMQALPNQSTPQNEHYQDVGLQDTRYKIQDTLFQARSP